MSAKTKLLCKGKMKRRISKYLLGLVVLFSKHLSQALRGGHYPTAVATYKLSWLYFNDVNTLCDLCYKEGRIVLS